MLLMVNPGRFVGFFKEGLMDKGEGVVAMSSGLPCHPKEKTTGGPLGSL